VIYEVYATRAALRDMNEAADYITYSLRNPQAAGDLLDHAEATLERLAYTADIYAVEDDPVLAVWGVRRVAVGNYLAFFTVSESERRVYVLRFLYYRRDWTAILHKGISLE